jgi:hypothetical protein
MTRTILPLAALALVVLWCAGCSGAPAAAGASNGASSATAAHEQAVKFAACMRGNGVSNFPDPNASGSFTIDAIANGSSIDTNSPAFQRAITACRDLEPPGFTGTTRTPDQQQAAVRFAQCIRDNGVTDFPDPAIDEPLIDTTRIPSTDTPGGMTILHAAMQKCAGLAQAAGVQR